MIGKIKVKLGVAMFALFVLAMTNGVYASSTSISSYKTLNVGATTTITASGSDVTGRFNVTSSNAGVVSLSAGSVWLENGNATLTATAKAEGSATISLTPVDVSNGAGEDITSTIGTKTVVITVSVPATVVAPATPATNGNANLKRLVPNYEGLAPNFNANTTKYTLTVPSTANSLTIMATPDGAGAKYNVSGNDKLALGDNTVKITVTATNGTKKTYTIIVTKATDVTKANAALSSIVIDGKTLTPVFSAETLEYTIEGVSAATEKLTVLAYAASDKATVVVTGNEKLVAGENVIKIKVTAEDAVTVKEYTVKVTKEAGKDVDIYGEKSSLNSTNPVKEPSKFDTFVSGVWQYIKAFWMLIVLSAFCLFEFVQIVYLYIRIIKSEKTNTDISEVKDVELFPKRRIIKEEIKEVEPIKEEVQDSKDDIGE